MYEPHRIGRAALVAAGIMALITACGGGGEGAGSETSGSAAATPTTPATSQSASGDASSTRETEAVAPSTTAAPNRPSDGPLEADTTYRVGDTFGEATLSFTTGSQPLTIFYGLNDFSVYDESEGVTSALSVIDLATLSVAINDPATGAPTGREPMPDDLVQWLMDQPFLELVSPSRPITAGDATGEVLTMRTIGLATATDGSFCGESRAEMTGGDPFDFEPEVGCAGLFLYSDSAAFLTFPGVVSEFAILRAGATNLLVVTERPAGSTVDSLLPSVTVEV